MELDYYFKEYEYFISLGYVVIISSILTLICSQLVKQIIIKKGIITDKTNESRKDILLSNTSRLIALITYTITYLTNELILNNKVIIDKKLLIGLITGSALTLTVSKGIYTYLHQYVKKQKTFKFLEETEINKWTLTSKGKKENEKNNTGE